MADTSVEYAEHFYTDPDGSQHTMGHCWMVRCNTHGTIVLTDGGRDAFTLESDPSLFCPHCADELKRREAANPVASTDLDADRRTDLQRIRQDEDRERRLDAR